METLVNQRTYKKLGFSHIEALEVVEKINVLIANYQMFFHKLQNFHWNVVGSDFYDIHEITEELYKSGLKNIDELAERVRVFGKTPIYKFEEIKSKSSILEEDHNLSGEFMIRRVISDLEIVLSFMVEIHETSSIKGDIGTIFTIQKMVNNLEHNHWKLSSYVNQKFKK